MALIPLTATLSSNGSTAAGSSQFSSDFAAWKAFDKLAGTYWSTTTGGATPSWIWYSFGPIGNEKEVSRYSITARADAGNGAPRDWDFQGFDDSITDWVTIESRSSVTFSNGETKDFDLSTPALYRAYRISISQNNGRSTTNIAEIELWGETDPQARVTQAATLVLAKDAQPLRTTQAATLVLAKDAQPIRTTQSALTVLDYTISQARVTQAAALALVTEVPCLMRRAQVWKITRTDGITFAFTTHDEPVKWMGLTYTPCDSLKASAADSGILSAGGGVGDSAVNGILSDDSITEHDLANGLFDGATVEVWLVPWDQSTYAADQPQRLTAGLLGKTSQGGLTYTAEMLTPGSKLTTRPLLEAYTPACRWDLGDGRCPVDLEALRVASTVTGIEAKNAFSRATFRRFFDTGLTEPDGYFDFGVLTWTTGDNAGLSSEVKEYGGGMITLWNAMPSEIQAGDQYTIVPGCNKTREDHTVKFGLNMVDFGGFPDIPGQDVLIRTPNAKG